MIYPYKEQSRVAVLPVSLAYAKEYLHRDALDTSHDTTITRMLTAARDFFEGASNNYLTEITFKTYRSSFTTFEIRRKPLMAISSIQYYDENDALQTVSNTNYFIKPMVGYDLLMFKESFSVPTLSTDVAWPIEITFTAGFTDVADAIPEDIADAILAHLAKMFENRGDAYEYGGGAGVGINTVSRQFVPRTTKLAILKYKVHEIGA